MIFFDIDDTLLDHRHAEEVAAMAFFRDFANRIHCGEEYFAAVWRNARQRHTLSFIQGHCTYQEQGRRLVREVLREPYLRDEEADALFAYFLRRYEANWGLFPDVLPALRRLKARNARLGVLCDGQAELESRKLETFSLPGYFEIIIICGYGAPHKPSPASFQLAQSSAHLEPGQCVYVGSDLKNDALAAVQAGWQAIWIDRTKLMRPDGSVVVITSLQELPRLRIGG